MATNSLHGFAVKEQGCSRATGAYRDELDFCPVSLPAHRREIVQESGYRIEFPSWQGGVARLATLVGVVELLVKDNFRGRKIELTDKSAGLGGAMGALHSRIFPLH